MIMEAFSQFVYYIVYQWRIQNFENEGGGTISILILELCTNLSGAKLI